MKYSGKSDVGKKRSENQDSFGFYTPDDRSLLAVVCDGMGGAAGGCVASRLALDAFSREFTRLYLERRATGNVTAFDVKRIFAGAVSCADSAVLHASEEDARLRGMGTTLCAVFFTDGKMYTANVGDSRAYLLRGSDMIQITHDHSYVQMLLDDGEITPEEARAHPSRNIITRAVGTGHDATADVTADVSEVGDVILLCSDGLSGPLGGAGIKKILTRPLSESDMVVALIDAANECGGDDNITALIINAQ